MWIVFGTKTQTELVPGGARAVRECERCGEEATFYERRVASTFTLYFIPVFDYRKERVMACGACGALFRTDEHGAPDRATTESWADALDTAGVKVRVAAEGASRALEPAAREGARMASAALGALSPALRDATERLGRALGSRGTREPLPVEDEIEDAEDEIDAVDPHEAELLRRFAELEKKTKR